MEKLLKKIKDIPKNPKLIVFDLDGTLAPSKSDLDSEMASLLQQLLDTKIVAVIGGAKYEQFQRQFLDKLQVPPELLKNLFLFPTTAASFYRYKNGSWEQVYSEKLSADEKKRIFEALEATFKELGYSHPEKIYGELTEDRGIQVTFSALGQQAPLNLKEKWKKEHTVDKLKIAEVLQKHIPDLEVRAAGYTSIDVTRKGIDKEYGIRQIKKHLGISFDEMLFVGDALFEGGNDYPALRTGVACLEVNGPEETKELIRALL